MKINKMLQLCSIIIACIIFTTSANAGVILWTINGAAEINYLRNYDGTAPYATTIFFVYSSATTFDSGVYSGFDNSKDFWNAINGSKLSSHTTGSDGLLTAGAPVSRLIDDPNLIVNQFFSFAAVVVFETMKVIGNEEVYTGWYEVAPINNKKIAESGDTGNYQTVATGMPALNNASWIKGYEYRVTIPEPATAGLALAGLALLFRRKRK